MLQLTNGSIVESPVVTATLGNINTSGFFDGQPLGGSLGANNCIAYYPYPSQTIYWNSYPVYVCTDKTAKAIEILKCLEKNKKIKCDSVPKFIELVEQIAGIL
jgi:hypothetical protein